MRLAGISVKKICPSASTAGPSVNLYPSETSCQPWPSTNTPETDISCAQATSGARSKARVNGSMRNIERASKKFATVGPHPSLRRLAVQFPDEVAVLISGQPRLQDHEYACYVSFDHRRRIKPEAGKNFAAINAVVCQRQPIEPTFAQNKPVDRPFENAPHDVLANSVAAVGIQLVVQVVADARRRHFGHELRRPFEKSFDDSRRAPEFGLDAQMHIRLRLIVVVEPNRCVVSTGHPGSLYSVVADPRDEVKMRIAVAFRGNR